MTAGRYLLGDLLGAGGMGMVFAATAPDGTPVAVKLLQTRRGRDAYIRARFDAEARSGMLVEHPNVVRVIDRGETADGVPFLVMTRVRGKPLGAHVRQAGQLPLRRAVELVCQLLAGLAALHRAGIAHGDVKTDNILVDSDDRVTLIDLGLARFEAAAHVRDGTIAGTPEYMAPEIACGGPTTAASDIYAAGVILYEVITGTTPFTGTTSREVLQRHLRDEVTPPSLLDESSTVPPALERIVLRALAKQPADRFADAQSFAAALADALPKLDSHSSGGHRPRVHDEAPTLNWAA